MKRVSSREPVKDSRLWFPIGAVWDLQFTDFTAAFLNFFHTTPLGKSVTAPLGNQSLTNC